MHSLGTCSELPVHTAVRQRGAMAAALVRTLVTSWPGCLAGVDSEGRTPGQLCLAVGGEPAVLEQLLRCARRSMPAGIVFFHQPLASKTSHQKPYIFHFIL